MAVYSVGGDELREVYTDIAKGKRVNIVGAGPSAKGYKLRDGEYTIVLNSMIKQYLDATPEQAKYLIAMSAESTVWLFPWMWNNEAFPGMLLGEKYAATKMSAVDIVKYPREFWDRFVWFERRPMHFTGEARDVGLAYYAGVYDVEGTVQLQALDLATRIMGASEVHSIGCELLASADSQHADGWNPYVMAGDDIYTEMVSTHQTQIARYTLADAFHSEPPEAPRDVPAWLESVHLACLDPDGDIYTTPLFFKAALCIRAYMREHPGVALIDHSGGLLNDAVSDTQRGIAPAKKRTRKAVE
jgi:hypothetical protein